MSKQRIELGISGMTCASCDKHVSHALEAVAGVESVNVPGWQSGKARVIASADVKADDLVQAVANAGYSATIRAQTPVQVQDIDLQNGGSAIDFDLLVIGGGSGGFAAAITASGLGKRVGMINGGTIGGTCVNIGCVPSKTLIRAAEAWHTAGHHPFKGATTTQSTLDWATIRSEKDALVSSLRQSKYVDVLAAYPDVTFIEGYAAFQEDGSVRVGDTRYTADRYVIATGAHPRMLPIPGIEEAEPLNSTTLMDLDALPESLIILGGRAVALELGQTMARLGVNVLILQRSTRLIPDHEPEIGRAIQDYLEREGMGVIAGVQVERLSREGDTRIVHARVMGQIRAFRADQILMATGREPNTKGLGLENVGVETDQDGFITINAYQQTTNPRMFAVGDVTTNPEFVYVAAAAGGIAASNALVGTQKPLDLSALPEVIFTDPQIAMVGLTERQARKAGYEVRSSTVTLEHVSRALAARDTRGLIKVIAETGTGRILGVHVVAAEGGEVIQTATLAVKFGLTIDDLTSTLFPYLTQVEGLKLAALTFDKDVAMLSCCAV
ncbi:MAG: mercury(II) reductase [Anaerolineaceae bacterium]|nr:mercury(II) reductase [Anaerolineaceae bacterium]